jgi:uncharacterized protein (TIGR03437 family)
MGNLLSYIALLLALGAAQAQTTTQITAIVSAASGADVLAPGSLVSIFGKNLTPQPVTILIQPAGGATLVAKTVFVSATQINLVMPAETPIGTQQLEIVGPEIIFASAPVLIQPVAPALFSADASGTGVAAALSLRRVAGSGVITDPIPIFVCDAPVHCAAVAQDVGVDTPLYFELFGTGIRGRSSLANVVVTIGGIPVQVLYAGPQGQFDGLDQINVGANLNLRGLGLTDIVVTVDGQRLSARSQSPSARLDDLHAPAAPIGVCARMIDQDRASNVQPSPALVISCEVPTLQWLYAPRKLFHPRWHCRHADYFQGPL